MLTEADANELIAATLARQALENEKALQKAIKKPPDKQGGNRLDIPEKRFKG